MRFHLAIAACLATSAGQALAASEQAIYTFGGGADGGLPIAGLVADAAGNLYGTAASGGSGNGVVFELSPPALGTSQWTQHVLHAFAGGAADGSVPAGRLTLGRKGVLFGTTAAGGPANQGMVFSLSPPSKKAKGWTETVLFTFTGAVDGGAPHATLIGDAQGNVYGTTTAGGTGGAGVVFRLSPPIDGVGSWEETVLYNFSGGADGGQPCGSLLLGKDGAIYGTTAAGGQAGAGTVFRLVQANEVSWSFEQLYSFAGGTDGAGPRDGLLAGPNGSYYGTTAGSATSSGTVYKLAPPVSGGVWTEAPLYNFPGQGAGGTGPWATVTADKTGTLYGTAVGDGQTSLGEVFSLAQTGGVWTASVLHAFAGGADSQSPQSTVVVGPHGVLLGTAAGLAGGAPGVVWEVNTGAKLRR